MTAARKGRRCVVGPEGEEAWRRLETGGGMARRTHTSMMGRRNGDELKAKLRGGSPKGEEVQRQTGTVGGVVERNATVALWCRNDGSTERELRQMW